MSIFIWSLYNCRVFEKERLTGWHHVASSPIAAYGLYRIAGDEWVRHEKLPDSWEIGQVVQWGGNAVSSVKLCQKLYFVLFLQTKKFKELNIQLKQICGINSSVILLRHIHKFLQVIVKDHSHPIYKYHTYKVRPTCIHPNLHLLTYTNPASDITNSHWSENTFLSEKSLGNFLCFWYLKMSEKICFLMQSQKMCQLQDFIFAQISKFH